MGGSTQSSNPVSIWPEHHLGGNGEAPLGTTLKGWQRVWLIVAVVLLPVVVFATLNAGPTREKTMRQWASGLRMTVERSGIDWTVFRDRQGTGGIARKPGWEEIRPEEAGTYSGMSDDQVVAEIHARYRSYLTAVSDGVLDSIAVRLGYSSFRAMAEVPLPVVLAPPNDESIPQEIQRIDSEHERALMTLRTRQFEAVAGGVTRGWMIPMAALYALGYTAQWWQPFLTRRRRTIGAIVLVVGVGVFVTGLMESDSFQGAIGAMMLVGGFLLTRQEGAF